MKKLILFSFIFVWALSCTPELVLPSDTVDETVVISGENRLSFETGEAFWEAVFRFSDTENRAFSYIEDIMPWEKEEGFNSLRGWYEAISRDFERIASEQEFAAFFEDHKDLLRYSEGAYHMRPPMSKALMNVLATDGTVEIADVLYKFTPEKIYIVTDGDTSKLAAAVRADEADEKNGIFIIRGWQKEEIELRSCGGAKQLSCATPQINDKRVLGNWRLVLAALPRRDQWGSVTGWDIGYMWDIEIVGQKRGWFGRWVSNATRLGFTSGFGINSALFGNTESGTGWVMSSNVSSIDHSFFVQGPAFWPGIQVPSASSSFSITYCSCGAKDANVPPSPPTHSGIFCYDCCPWDCSDLDWFFIQ